MHFSGDARSRADNSWDPPRSLHEVVNKKGKNVSGVSLLGTQDEICRIPRCVVETASSRCRGESTALWRKAKPTRRNALAAMGPREQCDMGHGKDTLGRTSPLQFSTNYISTKKTILKTSEQVTTAPLSKGSFS